MNEKKWKLLLASPIGCRVVAVVILGLCIFAVINNINYASGGYIGSFSELISYFGEDEIIISIMGIVLFGIFMYASNNAQKIQREQRRNRNQKNEIEDPYENVIARFEEKQNMKPHPYMMGSGQYKISFLVPPTYSWEEEAEVHEELGYVSSPVMTHETGGVVHCCYNVATEEELLEDEYMHPKELVQEDYELLSQKTQENTKILQFVVDGRYIVHYFIARYKENRNKFQRVYAACELEPGKVFEVEMTFASWEYGLAEKDLEPFFQFQE